MSTSTTETSWQPEPATFHPSLDEFQRRMAFALTPEPMPPYNGSMVKGMAYHAVCGTPISSKSLDDPRSGEYGCRTCEVRGFLAKPGTDAPTDPASTTPPTALPRDPATTRALVTVEAAERLAVRAHKALDEAHDDDLRMAPLSVYAAVQEARALLAEITTITTHTTCSMVKDQAWSDEISRQASERVQRSMALVERALGPL